MQRLSRTVISIQALRAFAYGFGSVLLGATLAREGFSPLAVGALLTTMTAGMGLCSLLVAGLADRLGRRHLYLILLLVMAGTGLVFALTQSLLWLLLASLTGTIATDTNDSGPISSLEQAMLGRSPTAGQTRTYGRYNAAAYLSGSAGALASGLPAILTNVTPRLGVGRLWFLTFTIAGVLGAGLATRLGPEAEIRRASDSSARPRTKAGSRIALMSGLFAMDSLGGGFTAQAFLAFWLERRFGVGVAVLGPLFFMGGLLQAGSSLLAAPIAARIGLVRTVAFTQVPGNLLIIGVAFCPAFWLAVPCLLLRNLLSQADIPARQAFIMRAVPEDDQTAAAAYTNTARYLVRPAAPLAAGALMQFVLAAPLVAGAGIKLFYDLAFYLFFKDLRLDGQQVLTGAEPAVQAL